MKETSLDYIKQLSLIDKKDLQGKGLKTAEEVGELSKKILPYTNAHGTLHRFIGKKDILEEVADIILCARSVAYDLGFDHQEIEDMVMQKADVWADLMKAEALLADKIPYEIHITVAEADQDQFIKACKALGVKPIILALQAKEQTIKDVMTSSTFMGSNKEAYEEMKRISEGLDLFGFKVLREKIETVPWHPAAPSREFKKSDMPKDCYFESHLGIQMQGGDEERAILQDICDTYSCHLSRNFFKQKDDGSYVIMATYRKYDGVREDFEAEVGAIKARLLSKGFKVDKTIVEFSIYDTKVSHDAEWLQK